MIALEPKDRYGYRRFVVRTRWFVLDSVTSWSEWFFCWGTDQTKEPFWQIWFSPFWRWRWQRKTSTKNPVITIQRGPFWFQYYDRTSPPICSCPPIDS